MMIARRLALLATVVLFAAPSVALADIYINSNMKLVGASGDCKYGTKNQSETFAHCTSDGTVILRPWKSEDPESGCSVTAWRSGMIQQNWHVNVASFAHGPKCTEQWSNGNTVRVDEIPSTPTPMPQVTVPYAPLEIKGEDGWQIPAHGSDCTVKSYVPAGALCDDSKKTPRRVYMLLSANSTAFCYVENIKGEYSAQGAWRWSATFTSQCYGEWKDYHTLIVRRKR